MQDTLKQNTIIEVLFKDDIKALKELFKKWFLSPDEKERKTKIPLIVIDEQHRLYPGRNREGYKYIVVLGNPSNGRRVAIVKFELQILDKGAM